MLGGWDRPDVARSQRDLVIKELKRADVIGPFAAFRHAMDEIGQRQNTLFDVPAGKLLGAGYYSGDGGLTWTVFGLPIGSLLDVGCGVGHYGVLCERNYPGIVYHGTDASAAIIAEAKLLAPLGHFEIRDFFNNDFAGYDIVLASQVMEMLPDTWAALRYLLENASGFIILNRLRLTTEPSHAIEEHTYCGETGRNWLWNIEELMAYIERFAPIILRYDYDNQATLLIDKGRR